MPGKLKLIARAERPQFAVCIARYRAVNDFAFDNPNIFQADGDIQSIDRSPLKALSIRCPHCLHVGTFPTVSAGLNWSKYVENASRTRGRVMDAYMRVCPNPQCKGVVFTVSSGPEFVKVLPPELLDFDGSNLPEMLLRTLEEAIACHSVGAYRAAAMMVRRLLEEICDDSNANGRTLHDRLNALKGKITLPDELFDAMGELKALGNDAAHITAKDYLTIGQDEAEDSIELAKEILKARYQLKGLVERLRARKSKSNPT